ncbi:class I SAM-dependent methyltransferase [Anaerocolumna chitinilytica]|uniref:Methyltransferase domain-containing protein n=1 Tax=Anaerocolumna chitinilytica TaxID=1727145 RepID=A0A7I8DMK6_9FIRM|nr:hypothetical protein bsdcttw_15620 [Anaerocolumna chitinilytica]
MVNSKEWDWEHEKGGYWLEPCEECYYYIKKWKNEGRHSILDLGCGLGRHSIEFAKSGFKVTAVDLSEYGVSHLKDWQKKENLDILTKKCDMKKLPFSDNAFDCIWAYHVISHTDTEGFLEILNEVERVLKPNGTIYLTMCSKETWSFREANFEHIDENTIIKSMDGPEKDVPHYYVDLDDIIRLFKKFSLNRIRHIDDCFIENRKQNSMHYYIDATLNKNKNELDYSDIIGKKVSGTIDRPMGTTHPKHSDIFYEVNYGYVDGIIAGDGAEQDIYLLGVDEPVSRYEGVVIAVIHRNNDIEDKWVVAPQGKIFSNEEILEKTMFQEKYFDTELYR